MGAERSWRGGWAMTFDSVKNNIPFSKPILIDRDVGFVLVVRSSNGRVVRKTGVASVLDGKVLGRRKLAA
jgi:hypothetical protein